MIRCDEDIRSAQFIHDDAQNAGKLLNSRFTGIKDFGLRRSFIANGINSIVVDVDYVFSSNQFSPLILLHIQKIIVLNGNAGFGRCIQNRVPLYGRTGGISVNENIHTVVHRNALPRKQGCHAKLCDGREDCLHRHKLGSAFCGADNALGKLGGNLIAKRVRDNHECTGILAACRNNASLVEIPLLLDFRNIAKCSKVICRRVCPASSQLAQEPVLIQCLDKRCRMFQAIFQNIICVLE